MRKPASTLRSIRDSAAVVPVLLALVGCTASKKMMQIAKDPSIPVGELRDQPSLVALSIVAAKDMNPNVYQPVEASTTGTALPYSVSLSGDDLADLAQQLKVTLKQVQGELKGTETDTVEAVDAEERIDPEAAPREDEESPDLPRPRGEHSAAVNEPAPDDDAAVEAPAKDIEEHGDGAVRHVGQYRQARDDEGETDADPRGSENANPVEISVYQLKDDGRFLGAAFDQLRDDPKKALGTTYLDHDEFVVRPGKFKFVRFFPVKERTQFIAVVASYGDVDSAIWKAVARIESTGGRYPLLVSLGKNGVNIQKEE